MFASLDEEMSIDEKKATTKQERVIRWTLTVVLSIILFGSLYFGIHLIQGI